MHGVELDEALSVLRAMADDVDVDGNWGSCRHGSYEAASVVLNALFEHANPERRRTLLVGALRIAGVLPMGEMEPGLVDKVHRAADYLGLAGPVTVRR